MSEQYTLPKNWRWVKLGEVCESESGVWGDEPDESSECYFVLRSNNIQEGKMVFDEIAIRKIEAKYLGSKSLKKGDILVTTSSGSRDLLGKSAIFIPPDNKLYLFSNFTMRLRANPAVDGFYLYFYLQSFEAKKVLQLLQDTTTGLRNLDRKEFLNQPVPLPPLTDKYRIAAKIQELMQEVKQAKESCEKQLEASQALPSAYLREVFESDEAKKWERKRLGEVCEYNSGIWGDEPDGSKYCHYVVRVSDIKANGTINYNNLPLRRIPQKFMDSSCLSDGDLLVVKSSGSHQKVISGRTALFEKKEKKIFFSNFLFRLKVDQTRTNPFLLWCYLNSHYARDYVKALVGASTYPNLKPREYIEMLIPLPPLTEQNHIATELKEKMSESESLQSKILNQQSTIDALPQAILRKAFRGEL